MEENQPSEQAAYKRGYSTIDHLHTVTQILEKAYELEIPFYVTFLDDEKAFDSIQHQAVLLALEKHGVLDKYINIIKEKYKGERHK